MQKNTYKNHAIWEQLTLAENAIDQVFSENQTDERAIAQKRQIEYLRWILEQSDCLLIGQQSLNSIQGQIPQITNHAANLGNYQNVENWFSAIFTILPYPRIRKIFKSETNRVIEDFTASVGDLDGRVAAISVEVLSSQETSRSLASELEDAVQAVHEKLAQYEATADTKTSEFDGLISANIAEKMTEFTERFSRAQSERSEGFQNSQSEIAKLLRETEKNREALTKSYADSIQDADKRLTAKINKFEDTAKNTLKKLDGFYDKAGQDALAADFAGNAEKENKAFLVYSTIASVFFIASAVLLGQNWISLIQNEKLEFGLLFSRLPVSMVFLLPTFYFASLGNSHRKSAIKLRSLGLRIRSFDAYLVNLKDDEEIKKLRKEMASEFFTEKENEDNKMYLFGGGQNKRLEELISKMIDKIPGK